MIPYRSPSICIYNAESRGYDVYEYLHILRTMYKYMLLCNVYIDTFGCEADVFFVEFGSSLRASVA